MTVPLATASVAAVEKLARDAGAIAKSHFEALSSVPVESKGHLDLVTAADEDVERFLTKGLVEAFPEDGIFGEEGAACDGTSDRTWVVDPIDGTFNFVRGGDQWTISIGLYEAGRPTFGVIFAPLRLQMLVGGIGRPSTLNGKRLAQRGGLDPSRASCGVGFHPVIPVDRRLETLRYILKEAGMSFRCCGSATVSLIEVGLGQVDGYLGIGESTWDLMAALPILDQIGIRSTVDWKTTDLSSKLRFACGTPEFLQAVEPLVPYGATLAPEV